MKLLVALCFVAVAVAAPAPPLDPYNERNAETVRYDFDNTGFGNYKYDFETSNGIRQEQQGVVQNEGREDQFFAVTGIYSWIGPNGVRYIVTYKADDQGYNADVEEEPGASPAVVASLLG